jgi:phage shock protein PspC (stress-responsive transcriptional regulator)
MRRRGRTATLLGMTATMPTTPDGPTRLPPSVPPPGGPGSNQPAPKLLRRSRTDRFAVGVCGGLGAYFNVDPVIFRIIFAVLAIFGGAGIVLYLLLWLAIPEEGTSDATLDRGIAGLRRRNVPFGLAAVVVIILVWALGFSWWTPHSLVPALIVGAIVIALLARRRPTDAARLPGHSYPVATNPVSSGTYSPAVAAVDQPLPWTPPADESATSSQLREWISESRMRGRLRRRRARPVLLGTLGLVLATVGTLLVVDLAHGVPLALYFWMVGAIAVGGLLLGIALRRTPWSITLLLVPVMAGLVAFGTTAVSAHDGWGQRSWRPSDSAALAGSYRLAFGDGTLDLRDLSTVDQSRTAHVRVGAGQLKLLIPRSLPVTVHADVHFGAVSVDGTVVDSGYHFTHDTSTPSASSGTALVIDATVADGAITIDYVD